jgi:hypothetical protein
MHETEEKLCAQEVQKWHRVFIKIRLQAELLEKCIAREEMYTITTVVYFASSGLYCFAFLITQEAGVGWMVTVLLFSFLASGRTLIKISRLSRLQKK